VIKVGCFETESEIKYQDEIHGSLFVQAEKSIDLIFTKYLKALISYEGVTRVETYPYPKDAIREAVYNPIIHKPYQSLNPIQIKIYDDRMLIGNTWRKPDGWTVKTILRDHSSEPYNPLIANAFFRAGFVEAWGRGIRKIFDECRRHGNPEPRYDVYPKNIMLNIGAPKSGDVLKTPNGPQWPLMVSESPQWPSNGPQWHLEDDRVERVFAAISGNPSITREQMTRELSLSEKQVRLAIEKLVEGGRIVRIAGKRYGHWETACQTQKGTEK
jgi:ATP-dependent DNA helicase RecG